MDNKEYDARRREIIEMLQTYKDERHNIERLTRLAHAEADADLYPGATDYSKDKVTCSFDSGSMGESMIVRLVNARKHLSDTLDELKFKSDRLDKLLLEITKLPAYQGRVVIGLYIDGISENDIAEQMGKSEDTICGYRKKAISRLTRTVNGERIRAWSTEAVNAK